MHPPRALLSVVAATVLTLSACSQTTTQPVNEAPTSGVSGSSLGTDLTATATAQAVPAKKGQRITKVMVLVVENHSLGQMRGSMPYLASLAKRYGYANDYHGVTYPSLPNYIAITSGSTHGIADDRSPSKHRLRGPSVFGRTIAAGRTAKLYADGMPKNCAHQGGGNQYVVKHNPWAYYTSERRLCASHDVPLSRLAADVSKGHLPNVGMLVPNMCHDAHNCPLSAADRFIRSQMSVLRSGPDWASGHLAVVLTADTDDHNDHNRVLTVVVHPSRTGGVVRSRLNHYSLSGLLSAVSHTAPLGKGASARSMARAFGLTIG